MNLFKENRRKIGEERTSNPAIDHPSELAALPIEVATNSERYSAQPNQVHETVAHQTVVHTNGSSGAETKRLAERSLVILTSNLPTDPSAPLMKGRNRKRTKADGNPATEPAANHQEALHRLNEAVKRLKDLRVVHDTTHHNIKKAIIGLESATF